MTVAAMPSRPLIWVDPRLKRLLAVFAVVVLIPASWWSFERVAWLTPSGEEIAGVVRAAATKNVVLLQPPPRYQRGNIPAGTVAALRRSALTGLKRVYTGKALAFWQGVARAVYSSHGARNWRSWFPIWSVGWVHLDTLRFLPGSVTATASSQEQNRYGTVNRLDYTFHLTHTSAGWRIVDESSAFEPGYGP